MNDGLQVVPRGDAGERAEEDLLLVRVLREEADARAARDHPLVELEQRRAVLEREECTDAETLGLFTAADFAELGISKGASIRMIRYLSGGQQPPPVRARFLLLQ